MRVKEVLEYLDACAPYDTQCEWDNSGLMCGSPDTETDCVMLALDCTNDVIEQAAINGCGLIVCHHPLIFKPVSAVESGSPLYNAVRNDIAVVSCHTNLDMAEGGVNDVLAEKLGLRDVKKLSAEGKPLMRMGRADYDNVRGFAEFIKKTLYNSVKFFDSGKSVKKVAVCGGAGGEYVPEAWSAGCDTLVTGEAKHHEFLEAQRYGVNLIAAGHFSTEIPVIEALYEKLSRAFGGCTVIMASEERPYETVV